ncbi:MAG TPA: hypothetical protein VFW28_17815, partial [Micropepsaceae bacterium]|nr:hypothetical protein [Micropepsaceae bacterium]
MRPAILNPLFADATSLSGVGPKVARLLTSALGTSAEPARVVDLTFHLPSGIVDRSYRPSLREAEAARIATVTVHVLEYLPRRSPRQPIRVLVADDTAAMEVVFFTARDDWIKQKMPVKARLTLSGRIDRYQDRMQMVHPDYVVPAGDELGVPAFDVVYRTTEGLPARSLQKLIRRALERLPDLPEWQDSAWCKQSRWSEFKTALLAAHAPISDADLTPTAPARMRLAFDELLANQLALALFRNRMRSKPGRSLKSSGRLRAKALSSLPFKLTASQLSAIAEITAAMEDSSRMLRLLQGDVGSGKTVVAMAAMLNAVEAGCQAALMAP